MDVATALTPPSPELAKRADIRASAQKFEASFLSIMMQQMFEGVEVGAPFGGGPGEAMFKSFMTEAMAKQMSNAGGIGLADTVSREMLKLQGLK
jgi:Rod binding domain-containing protein